METEGGTGLGSPPSLPLEEMICAALMNPCSCRPLDGTELGTELAQEDLGQVWQQLVDGRLTLCCQVRGLGQRLCRAGLQPLLCLASSVLPFPCRTRTPTRTDLFSTRCWLSTLTWPRDPGTWSSARGMCCISWPKVALQSCCWARLLESAVGRHWGKHGLSRAGSGSYSQACTGFCSELNASHEISHQPYSFGPGLIAAPLCFPVNEDWLEGRCNGKTGIFPKCFATQTSCGAAFL